MNFCRCESPLIDVEHDAGCRRCGLPVDFSPASSIPYVNTDVLQRIVDDPELAPVLALVLAARRACEAWALAPGPGKIVPVMIAMAELSDIGLAFGEIEG